MPAIQIFKIDVPFATLESTVAPLNRLDGVLRNEKAALLFQTTGPALNDGSACVLMENAMGLETIVGMFSHEDFRFSELNIGFREGHRNRLILHASDLFGPSNAFLLGIQWALRGRFLVLRSFCQNHINELDAQLLWLVAIHAPRQNFFGNGR